MPADRAFRLSVYLVVALGALALGAGDLLSPVMLGVFLGGLVGTWWLRDALGARAWLSQRGDIVATLSLTALAAGDLLWFADSFIDTFARLVCALLLVRLATWRVTRELRAAGFLSFSMLAAASAVAFGVAFLPLFLTYLATAIVMLVLFHLVTEAEAAGVPARPLGVGLTVVIGAAVTGTLAITALLFALIPRVEAALPLGARSSPTTPWRCACACPMARSRLASSRICDGAGSPSITSTDGSGSRRHGATSCCGRATAFLSGSGASTRVAAS
jgi:hypothetical protein